MSMWFWMNKAIKIGTNQGTLLDWILNFFCLDHDDVTWDSLKKGRVLENKIEQKGEDETWSFKEE